MDSILLPSWLTPDLVIAILTLIATVSGIIIASWYYYRKLKPGLRVQVPRAVHSIRYKDPRRKDEITGTELIAEFRIHNTGADTSIYDIEIECKPSRQPYRTTEKVQSARAIKVKKGDTINYQHRFYIPRRGVSETPLNCNFILHHTYGKKKVKAKSSFQG